MVEPRYFLGLLHKGQSAHRSWTTKRKRECRDQEVWQGPGRVLASLLSSLSEGRGRSTRRSGQQLSIQKAEHQISRERNGEKGNRNWCNQENSALIHSPG